MMRFALATAVLAVPLLAAASLDLSTKSSDIQPIDPAEWSGITASDWVTGFECQSIPAKPECNAAQNGGVCEVLNAACVWCDVAPGTTRNSCEENVLEDCFQPENPTMIDCGPRKVGTCQIVVGAGGPVLKCVVAAGGNQCIDIAHECRSS